MAHDERSAGFVVIYVATPGSTLYLLLDYGRHWDFPKGHVEAGEDDRAAAVRELREETGLSDPEVLPGFRHEITYFFRHRKRGLVRKTVVFFLARVATRGIILSPEHVGYEFLPYEAALKRVTFATAKELLRRAQAHLSPIGETPQASGLTDCRDGLPSLFDEPGFATPLDE